MTDLRTLAPLLAWTPFESAASGDSDEHPLDSRTVVNSLYQVSITELSDGTTWLAIISIDRAPRHDWRDLQRIKNELCGPEREAIEIYPAESRLVDTCNQFHLWVLPEGVVIPLGYGERDVADVAYGAHKQRPFDSPPADLNARIVPAPDGCLAQRANRTRA